MRMHFKLRPLELEVELGGARRNPMAGEWSSRLWPAQLYRTAARHQVAALLEENRRLRMRQPIPPNGAWRRLERLFIWWLARKYPESGGSLPGEIDVIEP